MNSTYTKEFNDDIRDKTYDGLISIQEFKSAFDLALESQNEIKGWFVDAKKEDLLKQLNSFRNYKNEKKEVIIDALVDDIIEFYTLGSYSHVFDSKNKYQGVINKVNSLTQKDLDEYAEKVKAMREERKVKIAYYKKAISNPETIEEFKIFIKYNSEEAMTKEQKILYDELIGGTTKEKQKEDQLKKGIVTKVDLPESVSLGITQTKHTKTREDLFVVKLSERVDKDTYSELNSKAKKLGGWYSSYTKDGAIAGFQFKDKEQAEKFIAIKNTDVSNVDKAEERQEQKAEKRADSLRKSAESIIERVDEELNRERQTNTARRASMANNAENRLRYEKSIALIMIKIADAIDLGETKYLDLIRTKAQVEQLKSILISAKRNYILKTYPNEPYDRYSDMEMNEDMVDFIHKSNGFFPELYKRHYIDAINKYSDRSGLKLVSERVRKIISKSKNEDYFQVRDKYDMDEIMDFASKLPETWDTNRVKEDMKDHKRLISMGIESNEMQRALLREFIKFTSGTTVKEDKVKELERKLAGRKGIGFDFFPTPKSVCVKMVELADITEGMSVLEPSAGNGNIADAVKEVTGVACDVCEISSELSEILKEKGYNVVSSDFLEYSEKKYDRILMNPPFSNRMDAEHIRHAYELLNPSGRIVAIAGEGVFFGSDSKAKSFQDWINEVNADVEKLDTNTFMDKSLYATTGVNARLLIIDKPYQIKQKINNEVDLMENIIDMPIQKEEPQLVEEPIIIDDNRPKGTVKQQVEDRLKERESSKEIKDVGRVQMSKKELAAYRIITKDNIDEINQDEIVAFNLVKKDSVYPKIDIDNQKAMGVSAGACFIKVKIREAIPQKPPNNADKRKSYVNFLTLLQNDITPLKTVKEVDNLMQSYIKSDTDRLMEIFVIGEYGTLNEESKQKLRDHVKGKYSFMSGTYLAKKVIEELLGKTFLNLINRNSDSAAQNWKLANIYEASEGNEEEYIAKAKERALNYYNAKKESYDTIGSMDSKAFHDKVSREYQNVHSFKRFTDPNEMMNEKYWRLNYQRWLKDAENKLNAEVVVPIGNKKRDDDWSWAEKESKEISLKEKVRKINTKTPLSYIKRVNGYKTPEPTPENVVNMFGFSAYNFGNYVPDKERMDHTRHFLGALLDLGETLNIDVKAVHQLGNLGFGVGLKGYGGHLAAYFSQTKDINLVRGKGDGSVAHEWGHYLDNVICDGSDKKSIPLFATQYINSVKDAELKRLIDEFIHFVLKGGKEIGASVNKTFFAIETEKAPRYYDALTGWQDLQIKDTLEQTLEPLKSRYIKAFEINSKGVVEKQKERDNLIGYALYKHGQSEYTIPLSLESSLFYFDSSLIGGKYWIESVELFARAFETFIYSKMLSMDKFNNYLAHDSYDTVGNPYPRGKEREKISGIMEAIIARFKEVYGIGDFIPVIDEKIQEEIVQLDTKKKESIIPVVDVVIEKDDSLDVIVEPKAEEVKEEPKQPTQKEQWEMTLAESIAQAHPHFFRAGQLEVMHRKDVKQALSEGKPVPAEVLAEYPDLLKAESKEWLEGGKADNKTLEDIAARHLKSLDWMKSQFEKGLKEEMEDHTNNEQAASEIVLDHLYTNPYMYDTTDNQAQLELENENELALLELELEGGDE